MEYREAGDLKMERLWLARWITWKRDYFDMIRDRPDVSGPLDMLMAFPGVIGGFRLGNYQKYLALHLDEEITRCPTRTLNE